jgi:hypothetical protein
MGGAGLNDAGTDPLPLRWMPSLELRWARLGHLPRLQGEGEQEGAADLTMKRV